MNQLMASAGYDVAAQCTEIIASPSAAVASVGTIAMHAEHPQADVGAGVYTLITSDERTVWGNEFQPFPAEAEADIQASKALLSFPPNNLEAGAGLARMPGRRIAVRDVSVARSG